MDSLSLILADLGFGLVEGRAVPLHVVPVDGQSFAGFVLGVEDIQARGQGLLVGLTPLILDAANPGLQGPARIGHHILQSIPSLQGLGPCRASQGAGFLAQEPSHARRLDAHQHGTTVEEDLIQASRHDQGLTLGIEPLEDPAGGLTRSLDPASNRGPSRGLMCSQQQNQQVADLIETEPHGLGLGGELLLLGLGKLDGSVHPVPKLGILTAEGLDFPDQLLARGASGVLSRDGVLDLTGLIVDGLTRTVGSPRLGSNGAVERR